MKTDWIAAARPKTLPAAVVPIVVGAAEAYRWGKFEWWPVWVCLAFALLAQIATNMANDYYDHIRGADTPDRVGPERLVASGKIAPRAMLRASLAVFAAAFLIGLALVAYRGWELLAVGVISILFGYGYTGGPFPLAYRGLGDVFVVFFFGLVATVGTFYVLVGRIELPVCLLGLAMGLLANNILVVNNYRDRFTDERAGKRTLVVRYGDRFGRVQYWAQLVGAFALLASYAGAVASAKALLPLTALPAGVVLARRLGRTSGPALNAVLAQSAALVLATGALAGAAIWWSA